MAANIHQVAGNFLHALAQTFFSELHLPEGPQLVPDLIGRLLDHQILVYRRRHPEITDEDQYYLRELKKILIEQLRDQESRRRWT